MKADKTIADLIATTPVNPRITQINAPSAPSENVKSAA